ncbi:TPA: hypothetical protein N0F65_009067 [Lagenidium giganteum]|uniref:NADPH-dependent diflavin oxidoreductase 1 n=1 Tax=Lagenidium giganteum TaxID=4803 RepID=A0AAV2YP59_9STRA|nr:TPA: hypothetical protein N0F65_009067 [Lagenidium giganteum]
MTEAVAVQPPRVLVLYGSETGTAQDVAEQVQRMALARNLSDTQVMAMDAFPVADALPQCSIVVFVVATTGDGEAPENMRYAWRHLLKRTLSKAWLAGVQVAVCGLGDSSYAKFNAVARRLQARLVQLGAVELVPRALGDDQHPLGYFGALNPWLDKLWAAVLEQHPLPTGFVVQDMLQVLEPLYSVTLHAATSEEAQQAKAFDPRHDTSTFYAPPRTCVHADEGLLLAKLTVNQRITAADWTQDVRHLELDISGDARARPTDSALQYKAGAIAVLYPENLAETVAALLTYVGHQADDVVSILATDGSPQHDLPSPCTLYDLFAKYLDIQGTPRRSFFEKLSLFASDQEEKEKLEELSSADGVDLLYDYCIREKKSYAEVLVDFPSVRVPLALLIQMIPRLRPRSYSISSSSKLKPNKVELTVAIVDFLTPYKRRRVGICSSYFQAVDPTTKEVRVPIWIKTGLFDPPEQSASMLLIGPGTGVAAMRAIVEERIASNATNASTTSNAENAPGDTHLYFGSRHKDKDFLYGDEFNRMVAAKHLTSLVTAFSRDQSHKIYVQTRLAENKEAIFELLMNGCYCFIAGSAKRMPTDVYEVLRDIVRAVGGVSLQEAEAFMKSMPEGAHERGRHGTPHADTESGAHPPYHSKLRAKKEERQQGRRPHGSAAPKDSDTASNAGGLTDRSLAMSTARYEPFEQVAQETIKDDAASPATSFPSAAGSVETEDDVKKRQRADARRVLIKYEGTIWDAAIANDLEMVQKYFLVEGATKLVRMHNRNMQEGGRTLLHTAAWYGHAEMLEFLLSAGAQVDAVDTVGGFTVVRLLYLAGESEYSLVWIFQTTCKTTALQEAARAGHGDLCVRLLRRGADPSHRDMHGDTAFHLAARRGHGTALLQMALELETMASKSSVYLWTMKNLKGKTVLDYVKQNPLVGPLLKSRLGSRFSMDGVEKLKSRFPFKASCALTFMRLDCPAAHSSVCLDFFQQAAMMSTKTIVNTVASTARSQRTEDTAFESGRTLSTGGTPDTGTRGRGTTRDSGRQAELVGVEKLGLDVSSFAYSAGERERIASR